MFNSNFSTNYYDFGAMEVNPPAHRRTEYGWSGHRLRAPKRGDKKNWKILLVWAFANFPRMEDMEPLKKIYNISQADIDAEKLNCKNRIPNRKKEAKRKQEKVPSALTEALYELQRIQHHPAKLKALKSMGECKDAEYHKEKDAYDKLTSPRKIERRMKLINDWKHPHAHDFFLRRCLIKDGVLPPLEHK